MKTTRQAAVLLLSAGLLVSGCSSSSDVLGAEGYTGPTLPARTVAKDKWEEGPAKPQLHKPYAYDLYTHCGIKWVHFGGRWWVLDTVFPGVQQVKGNPPPQGTQRIAGYMTLIDPDAADFEAAGMPTLQFLPAEEKPPGCD